MIKKNLFLQILTMMSVISPIFCSVKIVVVTPTYNNEKYCIANIKSVMKQTYKDFHHVIVNDCSSDRTSKLLHDYISKHNLQDRVTLIDNTERKGALQNLYETIHALPDKAVVMLLDGDDKFAGDKALERIAAEYKNPEVWLTYGQFTCTSGEKGFCRKFPARVMEKNEFRRHEWLSSHPRTFYAWLFKKIDKEDLLFDGKFFQVTWDLAIMFPMLEMASRGHIRFIPDVLYVYRNNIPTNDHRMSPGLQQWCNGVIRKKSKYQPL